MATMTDLLEDIDHAFDALLHAKDETTIRRTGRAVLAALFEVREIFRMEDESAYFDKVNNDPCGEILEGILVIRGRMTHGALDNIRPNIEPAVPSDKFLPSNHTFPGANLTWPELAAMPQKDRARLERKDRERGRYAKRVAGFMVLPTLHWSRIFLRGLAGHPLSDDDG